MGGYEGTPSGSVFRRQRKASDLTCTEHAHALQVGQHRGVRSPCKPARPALPCNQHAQRPPRQPAHLCHRLCLVRLVNVGDDGHTKRILDLLKDPAWIDGMEKSGQMPASIGWGRQHAATAGSNSMLPMQAQLQADKPRHAVVATHCTDRRPSSMPGPRNEAAEVRLALSKELLNTSLRPRLSAEGSGRRGNRDGHGDISHWRHVRMETGALRGPASGCSWLRRRQRWTGRPR